MAYNRYNNNPDALPHHAEPNFNRPQQNMNQQRPPQPPMGQQQQNYGGPQGYGGGPQGYNGGTQENWSGGRPQENWSQPPPPPKPYSRPTGGQGAPQGGYQGGFHQARPQFGFLPPRPKPPPTPQQSDHTDYLWRIFKSVDTNNSNSVSERELSDALVNSNYQRFDPTTIQMMIKMFDFDRSGSVDFPEFCSLWNFLNDWRALFDRFDKDRSGAISFPEFRSAMRDFGYNLSDDFTSFFFNVYVPRGTREISFDLFVQACVNLKRLTDVFKVYDTDQDGHISMSFEQFLAAFLSQRL